MPRIIPIQVADEFVKGSGVVVGAEGSHDDVLLEITFNGMWAGLTKRIVWLDALGGNPTITMLTASMLKPGTDNVYLVPIPGEPKAYEGSMTMSIKGAAVAGDVESRATMSADAEFKVLPSSWTPNAEESDPVSPSQAEQLQAAIDSLKGDTADQINTHNTNPNSHQDIRAKVDTKLDSATIKSAGIPEIISPETLRSYFYDKRKETSRSWQFEISSGSNENIINALGGFPDGRTASEKWFLYINLPYTEAGGFVIHAQLEGRDNGLLYRQDQFATLDQRWHTTGWIRIQDVQANLDDHNTSPAAHQDIRDSIHENANQIAKLKANVRMVTTDGKTASHTSVQIAEMRDAGFAVFLSYGVKQYQLQDLVGQGYQIQARFNHVEGWAGDGSMDSDTIIVMPNTAVKVLKYDHNRSVNAHQDIREAVRSKQDKLTGGTDGQVLTQTPTGPAWKDQIGKVKTVNGESPDAAGNIEITIPTKLSQLDGDSEHRTVTDAEKEKWNAGGGATLYVTVTGSGYPAVSSHSAQQIIDFYKAGGDVILLDATEQTAELDGYLYRLTETGVRGSDPYAIFTSIDIPPAGTTFLRQCSVSGTAARFTGRKLPEIDDGEVSRDTTWSSREVRDLLREKAEIHTENITSGVLSVDDLTGFCEYFYGRRNETHKTFEVEEYADILPKIGGKPEGASDSAVMLVTIPYSGEGEDLTAHGFQLAITYSQTDSPGLWTKMIQGNHNGAWKDFGWRNAAENGSGGGVTPEQLNEAKHTTLNVEIEDDGFGGYRADKNDNDINNHRNAGGIVQAKYYDSSKNQTYTYYYSTMESDRKPTFIRTYIEDGKVKQVLASVGNDNKVTLTRRTADTVTAQQLSDAIGALGTVFDYKGSKPTKAQLPSVGNKTGDVWFVEDESVGYIWLDSGVWEPFGPAIDLSGYLKKTSNGTAGQFAVSDGAGGVTWKTVPDAKGASF